MEKEKQEKSLMAEYLADADKRDAKKREENERLMNLLDIPDYE